MKALLNTLLSLALVGPVLADTPAAMMVVDLAPSASVTSDAVRLGQVAKLPEGSPLASVMLAPAPLPGCRTVITRGQVEVRLAHAGYGTDSVRVRGAESIVVSREARVLSPAEIDAALGKLLAFKVEIERLPPRRPLPTGTVQFRLRGDLPNPLPDQFSLLLDVLVDGRVVDQLNLGLRLPATAAAAPVAIDAAPLPMPARANGGAAQPAPAAATPATAGAAQPVAEAPRPAPPPKPTWQVHYGDVLTVTAASGRARICLQATARSQGTLGDIIGAEAIIGGQRRNLSVRLVAPDRAVMEF